MHLAVDIQLMHLGVEGLTQLARRTREVDQNSAEVDLVDAKAMRLEPVGDGVNIFLRHSKPLPKFSRGQPMVEIRRLPVVELVDQFVERLFLLGRALQQEEHVIDVEAVRDRPPIVLGVCLRARVVSKPHRLVIVNRLRDANRGTRSTMFGRENCLRQQANARANMATNRIV